MLSIPKLKLDRMATSLIYCVVEGKSDKVFITHIASLLGKTLTKNNFYDSKGYDSKYIEHAFPFIDEKLKTGFKPVIFADADSNFQGRLKDITDQLAEFNLTGTPVYLFPNHNSNGELEDLIFSTVPAPHNNILTCFDNYNNCITGYTKADNKSKLYAYSQATNQLTRENTTDFKSNTFWNLTQANLPSLYAFLQNYL